MKILILSSDKTIHSLPVTLYLLDKFWPGHPPIVVGGYTEPAYDLRGAEFYSIGNFDDYPVEKWSDGVIKFLEAYSDELIVLWMDDYWLLRDVDTNAIVYLEKYMKSHKGISRCDLTLDRAKAGGAQVVTSIGHIDIVTNRPMQQYTMSFQVGIWHREKLLRYLVPGETGWQAELNGTTRMIEDHATVVGTKQGPVRYLIAVQQGKFTLNGGYQGEEYALSAELEAELKELGYLP